VQAQWPSYRGTVAISSSTISGNTAASGGGVGISSGTVTLSSCTISGNRAWAVRAHAQNCPSPNGHIADVLASALACTIVHTSVNYSQFVPERLENFPSP